MSVYSPTITQSATPFIQVTTSDLTPYSEIQQTQGTIMYEATNLYYKAGFKCLRELKKTFDKNGKSWKLVEWSMINPDL